MRNKLEELIKNKKAKVSVMGLGFVGLPSAVHIAKAGFEVLGIDVQKDKVDKINKGESYILDVSNEELASVVKPGKLKAFNDYSPLDSADIILISVPTPLDKNKIPDISYIKATTEAIAEHLRAGQLIVLESSTYPGTTREVVLPILEKKGLKVGQDFFLAFCPERIDPGNEKFKFNEVARVAGGITKDCADLTVLFYKSFFTADILPLSSTEAAEITKIFENTFRLINISFVNEMALLCGKMGIDIWEVIEAAKTKPYGFMPFYPSAKIGGHCIPIGPFFLSYRAKRFNFWPRFIELAGEMNDNMPHHVITKVIWALNRVKKAVSGSKILIWGVSYKKDIGDPRESAAHDIISDLVRKGADVEYFDPFVPAFKVDNKFSDKELSFKSLKDEPSIKDYDLVLVLTDHSGFNYEKLAKEANIVVDTRNAIKSREHKNVFWL